MLDGDDTRGIVFRVAKQMVRKMCVDGGCVYRERGCSQGKGMLILAVSKLLD